MALLVIGGISLMGLGAMAATLALRQPGLQATPSSAAAPTSPAMAVAAAPAVPPPAARAATGTRTAASPLPAEAISATGESSVALATQAASERAPVCASCGTVESVQAVQHKGEGSGVGAVAGGVLGGVVGSQMGKGDGRKAMTVIGAVGGGLAGHEIEKRQRATTVYQVSVRMDDGSKRTVTRPESWAVGRRVAVEGSQLRTLRAAPSAADSAPRTLKTAAPA